MEKIEFYLNVLHFCFYKSHYKLHLFVNKINPFNLIHKLPFQKRRYEKLGIDIHEEINKAFGGERAGISIMFAGGMLLGVIFLFFFSIINSLIQVFIGDTFLSMLHFLVFILLSVITSYFFVFKNDKYLTWFKQFEKWTSSDKRRYTWFSVFFVLFVFLGFVVSLKLG